MWNKVRELLVSSSSFRFKVMFISIICLVIPATFTLFIYNYLTKDTIKEQAHSNANRELTIANEYVEKLLEDMMYISNFIQVDAEMNTILKRKIKSTADQTSQQKYEQFLDDSKIIKTLENITLVGGKSYVTILLENGISYTNYSNYELNPKDIYNENWFKELNKIKGYETVWISSQPTMFKSEKPINPYQISIARTLRDDSLNIYGYVIVTIMENKINQIFENMNGKEEMILLDSSNQIISHTNDDRIGEKFKYSDQLTEENSSNIFEISKKDYLIAEQKISFTGWKLVSLIPYKQATSKINTIFNKVVAFQVLFFTIFLILMTYLLRTITKPIVRLGNVADLVQQGDLNIRSRIKSKDEIGRLSSSFDQMLNTINKMIQDITATQERKRKAELDMLQAQINPHFLFNVLNSIRMKVMVKGDKDSANMISSLSKLLRMTISKDKEIITFQEEVQIVLDFINIMNMRQKEKVDVEITIHEEANLIMIPRFILQPIIENSIIHGLNQSAGKIIVNAEMTENEVMIMIEDNGGGMDEQTLFHLKRKFIHSNTLDNSPSKNNKGFSSIGISNVYERMYMTFGQEFKMDIKSELGKGTQVIMSIPKGGRRPNVQSNAS
ncbi:histidine kinase [Neobacillus sp. 179-C4.2 HS]|jgi:two-component system, sensor histidine kinase YesM|uniref:Histidine kinase n=1 Tax=Neobacillus driksii TaxID=3035913 RepID=A0ABV4Z1E4_9BACI|nr:sensor histidine kinase [Neobacillus sp. 179.-C4.2 HS]MDP5195314.1 histidine kinase [Neobacillus sp. 179.-C4.2 HS]